MSEYTSAGGALNLKSSSKKKHKKKRKEGKDDKSATGSASGDSQSASQSGSQTSASAQKRKTPAELSFEKAKRQKQDKELLKKAGKTHKERILDLNRHLDSLSEHYDIPKVSWTK